MNKFFNFLKGYVIIRVYGKQTARFLNICLRRGMRVGETSAIDGGIEVSIGVRDFLSVRSVARKCRVRVKIKEKHAPAHLKHLYGKRYAFIVSFFIGAVLCAVLAQFIWLVEINGADNCDIERLYETLEEIGIKRGGLKRSLPEGREIKRAIVDSDDNIAWAWVYIEGAKARVEIYEKIIPPAVIDRDTPCDIVAVCDGVIKKMTVKNGEERFKEGDAVRTGDVLVSGRVSAYMEGYAEEYILVHSIAEVKAYTAHESSGEYKLYYESRIPTGRRVRHFTLDVLGKAVSLPSVKVKYDSYDRHERRYELNIPFFGYSGIALDVTGYQEVSVNREPIPEETALEFAKNELEEKISGELTTGSELIDESIEYDKVDDETISVTLKMNFTENIAAPQPVS